MQVTPIARRLGALANRVRSLRSSAFAKARSADQPAVELTLEAIAEARLGQVLRGKYRLERVLGIGGMAAVYVATHRNRRRFAIKMLHPQLSFNPQVRARFQREGWLANSVEHSGVVAVLDDDVADDGSAFLVMELLDGESVESLWDRHSALPLAIALAIGDQLLDVLEAAHARRIVHRDLKPGNLFLTRTGVVKVLDFGIARLRDAEDATVTRTGTPLGTPGFMPPEQAIGSQRELSAQADLWAAGATLFSLISGHYVHEGEGAHVLLVQAATQPARSIVSVMPALPSAVARAIDRALAFDKDKRYATAAAMREALRRAYLDDFGRALDARAIVLAAWFEHQRESPARVAIGRTRPPMTWRRALLVLAWVLLLLSSGIFWVYGFRGLAPH